MPSPVVTESGKNPFTFEKWENVNVFEQKPVKDILGKYEAKHVVL